MQTTLNPIEIAKFAEHSQDWWDTNGAFKTLHDINPLRLDFIETYVELKDKRVLDVGCGGGLLSEGMAKRSALVTGLDVEPKSIEVAKSHALAQSLDIDYVCQPIETYAAEPFHIITCLEMLEHVSQPELVILHAARLLMPGGYLFLSTINRSLKAYAEVVVAAEYVLNLLPRQTHDYKHFIKPSELASMVRDADLDVVELTGLAYNPISRKAHLSSSVGSNYLMVCRA